MSDSPAYFDLIGGSGKSKLPNGNYRATIIDMTTVTDIKCGSFIADVFKPVYKVTSGDYKDIEVSDNGIFRYKQVNGYEYKPNKNWGIAKFMQLMNMTKEKDGRIDLPYLKRSDLTNKNVKIVVWGKSFTNEKNDEVYYPVARVVELINEVPF